jgi:hypothetical protein
MSNVIRFLEQMGRDADLRYSGQDQVGAALAQTDIDIEVRTALLNRDQQRLSTLLGARTNVTCILAPAKDDNDDKDDDGRGKDDDEVTSGHRRHRRAGLVG